MAEHRFHAPKASAREDSGCTAPHRGNVDCGHWRERGALSRERPTRERKKGKRAERTNEQCGFHHHAFNSGHRVVWLQQSRDKREHGDGSNGEAAKEELREIGS
jgi:hypothetical protein